MAFKQSNNPISRKTSPLRAGTFSMKDLEDKAASEKLESQNQANKLPQIEKPGADYEMDTDMTYAGGERGADYDEEGKAMSRKASPLNDKTGSKTIGEHMMTPTKHAKHVSTVHARHKDTLDRVQEKKDAAAAKQKAPSRKTHKK